MWAQVYPVSLKKGATATVFKPVERWSCAVVGGGKKVQCVSGTVKRTVCSCCFTCNKVLTRRCAPSSVCLRVHSCGQNQHVVLGPPPKGSNSHHRPVDHTCLQQNVFIDEEKRSHPCLIMSREKKTQLWEVISLSVDASLPERVQLEMLIISLCRCFFDPLHPFLGHRGDAVVLHGTCLGPVQPWRGSYSLENMPRL